jgi:enoyl-CoA hydratase/carnithine racemase
MSIEISVENRIQTLRFNRPDKKNAITQAMYTDMANALNAAQQDPSIRVSVFVGTNGVFSSGNDVADFLKSPPANGEAPVIRFLNALHNAEKPILAAVEGLAIGIGMTLLLHCDLAYASPNAKLNMPFVNIGLCPEAASSYLVPMMVGHRKAAELLMLGDTLTAQQAAEFGILNGVVDDVIAHTYAQATRLAAQPPKALKTTKKLMKQWNHAQIQDIMRIEFEAFAPLLVGEEAKEAMTAFMQKRKADFSRF